MLTENVIHVQGRSLSAADLLELQDLIDTHPKWTRTRVAKELCQQWGWQTPLGQLKTFAARAMLLTLAKRYGLRLPPVRESGHRTPWGQKAPEQWPAAPAPPAAPLWCSLESLQPLQWQVALPRSCERERALAYLREYHYLGCNRPVGTHLLYLVRDFQQRDLAVHLVGAAAWQCAARDRYLGWSAEARAANLHRIANHSRFLLLPWVRVPRLASHLLGRLSRRVSQDWQQYHGWRLELLETFVETGRFAGVAYRAANWQKLGQTTGRTRQEKHHQPQAPPKSVWVYGLHPRFRQTLGTCSISISGGAR